MNPRFVALPSVSVPLLLLGVADSLLCGAWALLRPADLFALLHVESRDTVLVRLLGTFALAHAVCLALAVWRPTAYGALVLLPLAGRALTAGVWLWCLAAPQADFPTTTPLIGLLVHDALWLPACAWCLLASRGRLPPDPRAVRSP